MAFSGDIAERYRARDLIGSLLDDPRRLGPDYQPIHSLPDGALVGVKAVGRGLADTAVSGTGLGDPQGLLAMARPLGLVERLDWAFRALAFADLLQHPELELHLTPEPETLGIPGPPRFAGLAGRANRELRVAAEIHEDAFAPEVAIDAGIEEIRGWGWRVVLTDVGDSPVALGRAARLRPDVVQIDLGRPGRLDPAPGHGVLALRALAAECGASIMALGVDTLRARDAAVELGASLARGEIYGDLEPVGAL